MENTKSITCARDILSLCRKDAKGKPVVYALKGERLTVISERGDAIVVQAKSGDRFPMARRDAIF